MMKLNEKLDYIKKISGFTDDTLAIALGLDVKEVKNWMLGREPDLKGYKALSKTLSLSLDYLAYDMPTTDKDRNAKAVIEKAKKEDQLREQCVELVEKCKEFLKQFDVPYDEKILPRFSDGKIDFNCFKIDGETIRLVRNKLIENGQNELIKKAFQKNFTITEAVKLDDIEIMKFALESYHKKLDRFHSLGCGKPDESYSLSPFMTHSGPEFEREMERKKLNEYLVSEDIDTALENLDSSLKHYFEFIVMLIDAGAQYSKQIGYGDDITCFEVVPDISKTDFFYRVASEMIGFKTRIANTKTIK